MLSEGKGEEEKGFEGRGAGSFDYREWRKKGLDSLVRLV